MEKLGIKFGKFWVKKKIINNEISYGSCLAVSYNNEDDTLGVLIKW